MRVHGYLSNNKNAQVNVFIFHIFTLLIVVTFFILKFSSEHSVTFYYFNPRGYFLFFYDSLSRIVDKVSSNNKKKMIVILSCIKHKLVHTVFVNRISNHFPVLRSWKPDSYKLGVWELVLQTTLKLGRVLMPAAVKKGLSISGWPKILSTSPSHKKTCLLQ